MPEVIHTGNVAEDEKAYLAAKTRWIQENPEEYRKMGGDVESVLKSPNEPIAKATAFKEGPAFKSQYSYTLKKAEAVPAAGSKASASDLAQETIGLQKEFPANATQLQVNAQGGIRILIAGKTDLRGVETKVGKNVEWSFKNESCEACSKVLKLTIEETSAEGITYLMQSEDEGAAMAYKFTFQLTPTN